MKGSAPIFEPLGDGGVLVTLGNSVDRAITRRVHACVAAVERADIAEITDVVPAYASFAVHYDARAANASEMMARLAALVSEADTDSAALEAGQLVTLPTVYNGVDLVDVARAAGLTTDEVVRRHSAVEYFVYTLGFSPGFAYLGDLDATLHLPRRQSPRARVPRGSVAIAGAQTAVYPHETPGGWHLLGTTDATLFDATREQPSLLRAGDRVRFVALG